MRLRLCFLALLAVLLAACNSGFPREPGRYDLQPGSLTYDGEAYNLLWVDREGRLQRASGDDVRIARDEQTYLEIGEGPPTIHMRADERVALRDRGGNQAGWWLPFLVGTAVGRGPVVVAPDDERRPTYRYPPSAPPPGETVSGSQTSQRPLPPERRVQPAPGTASGQAGGTGGGTAASSKIAKPAPGLSGGTGGGTAATGKASAPASGQVGGAGGGTAASGKTSALGGKSSSGVGGARSTGGFRGGGFRGRR
ncbi:MAG: hypothetical protein HYU88_08395 [Chloroflexi bacterium]|nr:hypothetical protein [Chloroflexota bacterium]